VLRRAFLSLFVLAGCSGSVSGTEPAAVVTPTKFKLRIANVAPFEQLKSGVFNVKAGATAPGPLAPNDLYEVTFTAGRGQRLAFASMLGQSNDWVFATPPGGIELYAGDGAPISGDVTAQVSLWDVGTEIDEEPAIGPHTGPNQGSSGDGPGAADPIARVRKVVSPYALTSGAMFTVPPVASMIKVTLAARGNTFTLRIQNVATDTATLLTSQGYRPVRLSPGVWTLSSGGDPLFSEGMPDRALGLEAIAESGNPEALSASLRPLTGLATPISPGVLVVHGGNAPFFTLGERDRAQGLERIAEDGYAVPLREKLGALGDEKLKSVKLFDTPVGRDTTGPARPGGAYEIELEAVPGDRLSFVTMFGWSSDWFFGTDEHGIELFDGSTPVYGPVTGDVKLFDVGSELSEESGVGPHTGPQQPGPDSGPADTDVRVREVTLAEYGTPVSHHLSVQLSPSR